MCGVEAHADFFFSLSLQNLFSVGSKAECQQITIKQI